MLIAEELLMIALDDEEGTEIEHGDITQRNTLEEGLSAALILELMFADRVALSPSGEVSVAYDAPTGDAILDLSLEAIVHRTNATPTFPLTSPIEVADLKEHLLNRLVEDQVLRRIKDPLQEQPDRFLWVIPPGTDPNADTLPERLIRKRIREVVLDGFAADERLRVLICLVQACSLVQEVFPKHDPTITNRRIEAIVTEHSPAGILHRALQQQRLQRTPTS